MSLIPYLTHKICQDHPKLQQSLTLSSHWCVNLFRRNCGHLVGFLSCMIPCYEKPLKNFSARWEKYTHWTRIPIPLGDVNNSSYLFIGAQPIKILRHLKKIAAERVTLVIDLRSEREKSCYILNAVERKDWEAHEIDYEEISCNDFEGIEANVLEKITGIICNHIAKRHGNVYVGCSKGKGRSTMGVQATILTFLAKTSQKKPEEVTRDLFNDLKSARPEIGYSNDQLKKMETFAKSLFSQNSSSSSSSSTN